LLSLKEIALVVTYIDVQNTAYKKEYFCSYEINKKNIS